ncbi:MAG: hypothetical protein ACKO04_04075 [Actinomycetes bacterium]
MTTTEAERLRLLQRLEEVLGPDEASTLMDHLPPLGWSDVATKGDLAANRVLTKTDLDIGLAEFRIEMTEFRSEVRGELAEFREEFGEFRTGMRAEMADFRDEMRAEMADFRTEMRAEMTALRVDMHQGFRNQILALVSLMFAMMALYTGLVVAVLR